MTSEMRPFSWIRALFASFATIAVAGGATAVIRFLVATESRRLSHFTSSRSIALGFVGLLRAFRTRSPRQGGARLDALDLVNQAPKLKDRERSESVSHL